MLPMLILSQTTGEEVAEAAAETVEQVSSNVTSTFSTVLNELGINLSSIALSSVISAVVVFVVCIIGMRVITGATNKILNHSTKIDKTLHAFIKSALRVVLWALTAIIVIGSMGFNISSLVAVLSVAGLAVSLAMQNSLSNLAGGIQLLISKPYVVGDFVQVGSETGTVLEVGLVYTKINTLDNKRVSIPNSTIAGANIINYSTEGKRRVDLTFDVGYESDIDTVKKALHTSIARCQGALADPEPFVRLSGYKDSAITYTVRVWCLNEDYWDVYFFLMEDAARVFQDFGISMTYNHLNVHMLAD